MSASIDDTKPESLGLRIHEHQKARVEFHPYGEMDRMIFNSPVISFEYTPTGATFKCANGYTYTMVVNLEDVFDDEWWEFSKRRDN